MSGKQYAIKVLVQLPDGSFLRCPLAQQKQGKVEVVYKHGRASARVFVECILPEQIEVSEMIGEGIA